MTEARTGRKISLQEVEARGAEKMARLITAEAEVEGQSLQERVICPWCGAIGVVSDLPETEAYLRCENCGQYFDLGLAI